MAQRDVRLRALAASDIEAAIDHLRRAGGPASAASFVDALERAITHIGRSPNSGSPGVAFDLGIPDLRAWPVRGHPYVIFYLPREDRIDVWRVLHQRRDIPAAFGTDR